MEVRSSRRMRTLVTQMARRGLSANEVARALISMMARSVTSSNQRPDTLMQDRSPPTRQKPLATHGRTIHWVKRRPDRSIRPRPIYPRKQTSGGRAGMAEKCHVCRIKTPLVLDVLKFRGFA